MRVSDAPALSYLMNRLEPTCGALVSIQLIARQIA